MIKHQIHTCTVNARLMQTKDWTTFQPNVLLLLSNFMNRLESWFWNDDCLNLLKEKMHYFFFGTRCKNLVENKCPYIPCICKWWQYFFTQHTLQNPPQVSYWVWTFDFLAPWIIHCICSSIAHITYKAWNMSLFGGIKMIHSHFCIFFFFMKWFCDKGKSYHFNKYWNLMTAEGRNIWRIKTLILQLLLVVLPIMHVQRWGNTTYVNITHKTPNY